MDNTKDSKRILIDFDGTCVANEYPAIGKDIGAVPVLQALVKAGHKLVLWTRRDGKTLKAAEQWFEDNNIKLDAVNPKYKGGSSKIVCDLIIDDKGLNTPVKKADEKLYVNWVMAKLYLEKLGLL